MVKECKTVGTSTQSDPPKAFHPNLKPRNNPHGHVGTSVKHRIFVHYWEHFHLLRRGVHKGSVGCIYFLENLDLIDLKK